MVDNRYRSQIVLSEIGQAGQNKLAAAKVLCVGAGGLAAVVVPYLVASGVGQITVCDADIIEESNLNRQIWFTPTDIGKNKALTLVDKLAQQNPSVTLIAVANNLTVHNCGELVTQHDLVLDCSDDYNSKLLMNDTCRQLNTAWVYASVLGFDGQVIFFANRHSRDELPCLRCYLQHVPITQQSCNISGVLGASVSLVGSYQATLALQALLGNFELAQQILVFDLWSLQTHSFKLSYNVNCQHGLNETNYLAYAIDDYAQEVLSQYSIVDIRTLSEWDDGHIPQAEYIPIGRVVTYPHKLFNKEDKILLYCNNQQLSQLAVANLRKFGYNAWWLKEGYLGYQQYQHDKV